MTHVSHLVTGDLSARAAAVDPPAQDRERARRFAHEEDRARSLLSAHHQREAAAHVGGVPAHDVRIRRNGRTCSRDGDHGRPVVRDGPARGVHLSATHAGDVVVVVASRSSPVGVDVELVANVGFPGFDTSALAPRERAAVAALPPDRADRARAVLWTRKEAVLKATGFGLSVDPASLEVVADGRVRTTDSRLLAEGVTDLRVLDLQGLPDGHVGSVAADAAEVVRLARPRRV